MIKLIVLLKLFKLIYILLLERMLESFEMWCWRKIEKIQWSEKVTNEVL